MGEPRTCAVTCKHEPRTCAVTCKHEPRTCAVTCRNETTRVRCHMQAHHGGGYGLRASLPPLNPAAPGPYRYLKDTYMAIQGFQQAAYPDGVKLGLDFFRACDRGGRKRTGEDQSRAAGRDLCVARHGEGNGTREGEHEGHCHATPHVRRWKVWWLVPLQNPPKKQKKTRCTSFGVELSG